jgi:hypothetical protein
MKVGVIVDRGGLAVWQAEALRRLGPDAEIVLYDCLNSRAETRRARFALYYLLNLAAVRNPLTRRVPVPEALRVIARRPFEADYEGAWQRLPEALLETMRRDAPDVIVKFGMGLLRVPDADALAVPILSYHHGDPARFRGRPAGFHELIAGEPVVGQVVQILSNRLDSGKVAVSAETKVVPHSWRATLMQAYRLSPLLLQPAIEAALAGSARDLVEQGRNYRLPSNRAVARSAASMAARGAARLAYGAFKEKAWRVATVDIAPTLSAVTAAMADRAGWTELATPAGFRFLADPFFHPEGGVLAEGLNAGSARGQLVYVDGGTARVLSGAGGHFSYPSLLELDGERFVIPEVSEWSPALAFPLDGPNLGQPFELKLPGERRLLDPTAHAVGGKIFLFGNLASEGSSVLRLWVGEWIEGAFAEHPSSPIRMSPQGARMAGGLAMLDGRLMRFGQDFRGAYGDGLVFFHVTRIDPEHYAEEPVGDFRLNGARGPHTLNICAGRAVFDYYDDRYSPLAGVRRLRERRAAKRVGR